MRLTAIDWDEIASSLDERGYAVTPALLTRLECRGLTRLYDTDRRFRKRIVMEQHAFGVGEYKYFANPLPPTVRALRRRLYVKLAPLANRWRDALNEEGRFPPTLEEFLEECHAKGQNRPTPLLLRYAKDGYNCLHQDLYGPQVFPLQLTVLLSAPGSDFTGGEFLLYERRPRRQSRAEVVPLGQGQAVIFAVHHRPERGSRGFYRVEHRHGVSRLRSGERYALGIIFHDAA